MSYFRKQIDFKHEFLDSRPKPNHRVESFKLFLTSLVQFNWVKFILIDRQVSAKNANWTIIGVD